MALTTMLDALIVGAIAPTGIWVLSQTAHAQAMHKWPFRVTIWGLSCSMFAKCLERMFGDTATWVDVSRDAAILALLATVISFHEKRFGNL